MSRVYLDYNATTPLRPEARAAMLSAMDLCGNPSSVHAEGRTAKAVVEKARAQVAHAVGCKPQEVVFTSGATEAARLLSQPHSAPCDVFVDQTGHDAIWAYSSKSAWGEHPTGHGHTLAMGLANNETGVISEIPKKVEGQWPFGGARADWLCLDVTQTIGRVPFTFSWSGADFAILSAHKLGGPKGVGALILREGLDIDTLAPGGGQEMGRRGGTENVIGITGFGAAAEAAMRDLADGAWGRVELLRDQMEDALAQSNKETIFVGKDVTRLPNTSCVLTPGWKGETQVMQMDLAGFAISAGSACSSGKVRSSRVLRAMGYSEEEAASAIRVSLGLETREEDIMRFVEAWGQAARRYRARAA